MDDARSEEALQYDVSLIRTPIALDSISMRGEGVSPLRLREIKKGLLTLHTLEIMAVNIYRFQVGRDATELNRQLIAAMCNEMTHIQDFQVKLLEYGWRPSKLRWVQWIVGCTLGFVTRLMGEEAVLRADIWFETKAVAHYGELLDAADWDEDTRKVIAKDRADEHGHVARWQTMLRANEAENS
jgi:demethoxyubiquinone hydroxylase (CLK1/Coq7/Cat5 family)